MFCERNISGNSKIVISLHPMMLNFIGHLAIISESYFHRLNGF